MRTPAQRRMWAISRAAIIASQVPIAWMASSHLGIAGTVFASVLTIFCAGLFVLLVRTAIWPQKPL